MSEGKLQISRLDSFWFTDFTSRVHANLMSSSQYDTRTCVVHDAYSWISKSLACTLVWDFCLKGGDKTRLHCKTTWSFTDDCLRSKNVARSWWYRYYFLVILKGGKKQAILTVSTTDVRCFFVTFATFNVTSFVLAVFLLWIYKQLWNILITNAY